MRVSQRVVIACATAIACCTTSATQAGYSAPGYDLQVVKSATGLANSAISYQTNGLWSSSGAGKTVTTSFTSTACESISFSRLYLDIWGGTKAKTCIVTAYLNGTSLGEIAIGGEDDKNSDAYDATKTCVYGSGSCAWQIAYAGISPLLYTDGTANTLTYTITDTTTGSTTGFDGRTYGASLVTVYSDASIQQTLDYYLAEADGTMRSSTGNSYGSPNSRTLTITGIDTDNVASATYIAGYTHGTTTNSADQLTFNGTSLGVDPDNVSTGDSSYLPNNLSFDVADLLKEDNTIQFSVYTAADGTTGDTYLRPNIAVLAVTHTVPEPSTLALLAVAGGVAAIFAARRRKRS